MKRAEGAPGPGMRKYLHMWPTVVGAFALEALALTFFARTVAADRPRGLHVGDPDVITSRENAPGTVGSS